MKITKLETQKNSQNRASIFVDEEFFAGVSIDLILKLSIYEGKEVTRDYLNEILETEEYQKCLSKTYDYISRRLHSEKELKTKLRGKFSSQNIHKAIDKLKELGYINDRKFAEMWVEQRQISRGKYVLNQELIKKGVDKELIAEVLAEKANDPENEFEIASNLAIKKLKEGMSKDEVYLKIGGYLSRRGFSYEIVKKVINDINSLLE
jgi:regulatory protein